MNSGLADPGSMEERSFRRILPGLRSIVPHASLPEQVQQLYMQEGTQKLEDGHACSKI